MASTNISDGFHHLEEKLWANEKGFHYPENLFPSAGMKDFVEKYFSTTRKKTDRSLKNGEQKWFPLAEKSISPTTNKLPLAGIFLKTEFRLISNMVSTSKLVSKIGWQSGVDYTNF